jgi:hypothetical protein
MTRQALPFLLLITAALGLAGLAAADSLAPARSYTRVTPDGRHVLVMLSSWPGDADGSTPEAREVRRIRRSYPRSGLYRNDGSATPLWTVDWWAQHVEPASDGVHMVRRSLAVSSAAAEAVAFFKGGKLLRSYRINELVDDPARLPRSVSHLHWLQESRLDDVGLQYFVTTVEGKRFVFDSRTGAIVREPRPVSPAAVERAVVAGALLCFFAWLLARRRRLRATDLTSPRCPSREPGRP